MQCTAPGLDLRLDRLSLSTEAPPVPVEGSGAVADLARRHITPEMTSAAIIQKMSHIPVGGGEGVITKRAAMCISPSVLAADFAHLADEVQRAEKAGANALHVDIMDGHFVRNLSMGQDVVAAINRSTNLPLHVHLMVEDPPRYINRFVQAGADALFFHVDKPELS